MILIKTKKELEDLRESGKILHAILEELQEFTVAGTNLLEINELAEKRAQQHQAICSFKGYKGFSGSVCLSVNEEVVHSPPKDRYLQEGDILSIDMGITYQKMISDSAITFSIGKTTKQIETFLQTNKQALYSAIDIIQAGIHVGDIGACIQKKVEGAEYSIIRELTGHGVGRHLHEDPFIPNFGKKRTGPLLKPGMTIAIEPIIAMGKRSMETDKNDKWTVRTTDGSLASQFEHTLIVHEDHAEIVT